MDLQSGLSLAQSAAFFVLLFVAGVIDVRERRVPNRLSVGAVAVGLLLGAARGFAAEQPAIGFLTSVSGLAVALVIFLPLYWLGGVGAGDAKLMGAVGALTSWRFVLWATACTAFAGAALALGYVAIRGNWREAFLGGPKLKRKERIAEIQDKDSRRTIPYGIAIIAGCIWAVAEFARRGFPLPWETL